MVISQAALGFLQIKHFPLSSHLYLLPPLPPAPLSRLLRSLSLHCYADEAQLTELGRKSEKQETIHFR